MTQNGQISAWKKLVKHPLGAASLGVVFFVGIIAALGYLIVPDSSPGANQMHLSIANLKPLAKVGGLKIPAETPHISGLERWLFGAPPKMRFEPAQRFSIQEGNVLIYSNGDPVPIKEIALETWRVKDISEEDFTARFATKKTFVFGTDKYGRDLLSRLVIGSRISFSVGFVAVFISLFVGIPLGLWAGYFGGWIDKAIMWLVNVVWSIPTLLMVIALTLALGKGFWQVFIAVGLTMWVEVARVVRGQVVGIKNLEYVEAATVLGFGQNRIMWRHILPAAIAPLIVISAANFASAILIESGLSFLGIGAQPPTPSWGGMIKDHYYYLVVGKPHLALIPGFCILLLVLSFMTLGNTLRDVLDVKSLNNR